MNFSFAGCGFLGIYHVGVASCLKQHAPYLIENGEFLGASAGAIVSCCLICDCCLGECTSFTLRLATKARSKSLGPLHPSFNVARILHDALHEVLPDNAHEIASGKLHISLTRISDRKPVLVSQYSSKAELIQALLCSAHVPFYSGLIPPAFRGTRYVDGGLSDNLPILNDDTITVSPFSGESDICPCDTSSNFDHIILANTSMQCTVENVYRMSRALFPPRPEILSDMCKQGFDDCLKFLQKNNLISCTRHLSVRSSIMPMDERDTEEEEEHHVHYERCDECHKKVQGALTDTLPTKVVDVFQVACASANHGLHSYIHRSPPLRIASTLVASWFLPADFAFNLAIRVLEYLPSLPSDVKDAWAEVNTLLQRILHHIYHKRRYTARFSCQLAITEVNFGQCNTTTPLAIKASPYVPEPVEPTFRNLNIGFAVDFESKGEDPLKALTQLENLELANMQLESHLTEKDISISLDQQSIQCHQDFDTFEQCLHITNQMESVMAYYYKDENNPKCYNFQEIYNIDSIDIPHQEGDSEQELSWDDSCLEYKLELEDMENIKSEVLSLPDIYPSHSS